MSTTPFPRKLVIATRASRLALWQAHHVADLLRNRYPGCEVELLEMTTRGDQILDRTLSKVGGKGLFVKELETALHDGRADLAVHSLKDVPMELPEGFSLAAVLPRGDVHDALVSSRYDSLEALPEGAVVGTSSLRREAQIRARWPHLDIKPLRGNLDTRLGKLDAGEYDAIVLAATGLQRLGMAERIRAVLPADLSLPAAGQGALGIEIRADRTDVAGWLAPLVCPATTARVAAERAVSRALGGSCQVPLAAYAEIDGDDTLWLRALVATPDGRTVLRAEQRGAIAGAEVLGTEVAAALLQDGAAAILEGLGIEVPSRQG